MTNDQSNMPENTAFKQQRLPAWQPVLTAKNVLPTFLIIGIIFIPLGVILLVSSNNCYEQTISYTECQNLNEPTQTCAAFIEAGGTECTCTLPVEIPDTIEDVYLYYRLTNFYQNHRIYVRSRDNAQLAGKSASITDPDKLSSDCEPYRTVEVWDAGSGKNITRGIAPCGTIANSMFTDTFTIKNSDSSIIGIKKDGIAWVTDHTTKFNNPSSIDTCADTDLECQFPNQEKPPAWINPIWDLSETTKSDPEPAQNGYENEAFEVWMRTAAFPTFRKLYGTISELKAGNYTLNVNYRYPVVGFEGTKSFVIAQMSWAGGKNPFLGIAYIVVGCLSCLSAIALFLVHKQAKKRDAMNSR